MNDEEEGEPVDRSNGVIESLAERESVLCDVDQYLLAFGYSPQEARQLVTDFRDKWMDPAFCRDIGVFWRSVDYVGHEGPAGTAVEIHYYQGLQLSLHHDDFLAWRRANRDELRKKWRP